MTYAEVVREYFPDASDEGVNFILWEWTGFPGFWNIPRDGETIEACLRKQLRDFQKEVKNDRTKKDK